MRMSKLLIAMMCSFRFALSINLPVAKNTNPATTAKILAAKPASKISPPTRPTITA